MERNIKNILLCFLEMARHITLRLVCIDCRSCRLDGFAIATVDIASKMVISRKIFFIFPPIKIVFIITESNITGELTRAQ